MGVDVGTSRTLDNLVTYLAKTRLKARIRDCCVRNS